MVKDGSTKKPTSAYGFFVKMCYEEHKKKYPSESIQVIEISKKCSEKWKTMSDVEKRRFYELAQKDTERYQAEMVANGDLSGKRKRKKKDPDAPKRALSAFFCFSQTKRSQIQQAHPEWRIGQVAQELGRQWKEFNDADKRPYAEMATKDRARYEGEMKDFKAGVKKPRGAVNGLMASASASGGVAAAVHAGDEGDYDDDDDVIDEDDDDAGYDD